MRISLCVLLLICIMLSACASREDNSSLVGAWRLTEFGSVDSPVPAVPDAEATLTFEEEGRLTGTTGCNELGGDYTVEGDTIAFIQVVSTLILCPELQMEQEETMLQVLSDTATFSVEGDTLTIVNEGTVLIFEAVAAGS